MNEWYLLMAFVAGMAVGQHITIRAAIKAVEGEKT
jgi:hypothetical protein